MDRMPWLTVFLISFPEEIMISALGLSLVRIRVPWGRVLACALLQAIASYCIRLLPIPFGVHTLVQALVFALILGLVLHLPYRVSLVAMLLSITIYAAIEALAVPVVLERTGIPLEQILADPWLRIECFLPQGLVALALLVAILVTKFYLIDLSIYQARGPGGEQPVGGQEK